MVLFLFSSVPPNESNSNVVNFLGVGYTIILTQKKMFHLFFSGNSNSRRWFSESVAGGKHKQRNILTIMIKCV